METLGFSSARSRRSVICCDYWLKAEWTLATTTSICSSTESERSSSPSARMSTSMPAMIVMPSIGVVGGANARDVLDRPLVVETVGEGQVLGVVGDGDVLVAALLGGFGHLLDGVAPVGFDGVHVHFAAHVLRR